MTRKLSWLFKALVFILALGITGLGTKMLLEANEVTGMIKPTISAIDSTYTMTQETDTLKNHTTVQKTSTIKNYKTPEGPKGGGSGDGVKLLYENAYKYISLGILIIFLLFLFPFLQEFNILGLFSGKFRDRLETMKAISNQAEQAAAQSSLLQKPKLRTKKFIPSRMGSFKEEFRDVTETEKTVAETAEVISYPEDPQKGKWGSKDEANHRKILATVTPDPLNKELFIIQLKVISTDPGKPLRGTVVFHLHPTFINRDPIIYVRGGQAVLDLKAWGAFTVGAEADNGDTQLEIDLSELPDAPLLFRSR